MTVDYGPYSSSLIVMEERGRIAPVGALLPRSAANVRSSRCPCADADAITSAVIVNQLAP
jgi:hypothetical protein